MNRGKREKASDDIQEGSPLMIPLMPTGNLKEDEAAHGGEAEIKDDTSNKPIEPSRSGEERKPSIKENEKQNLENGIGKGRTRRVGTTVSPHGNQQNPKQRKISFANDVEQRIAFVINDDRNDEDTVLTDLTQDVIPEIDDNDISYIDTQPKMLKQSSDDERDRYPFLEKREARFSTNSRYSMSSRTSFRGLASRASMVSLKETLSKVNSELYPERGSFISRSLGQSFAELPESIAQKLYIVTQVLAAVSVSMGSMAVGFSAAYTSPAFASMNETNSSLTLTDDEKSWVGSLMPLCALVGGVIGGYLIDALGRKMLILICGPPFFAAMIIIGSAFNVWMLYVGRAISGLCVGLLALTLPVYLGETIQPEIRGTLGLLPTTIGNTGILICYLVGTFVNWSWLAYIGSCIPLLFFFMMIFVPETPRWYVSKGQDDNAERSLQWLRGSDNDVEFELEAIQQNYHMSVAESSSLKDLFKKQYSKAILLSLGLMLVQQLSGINAVIFYSADIFILSGSKIDTNLSTIIVGVVNVLSTFAANIFIDRLGRKILLYISDFAMVLSLFALGTYFYLKDLAIPIGKAYLCNATLNELLPSSTFSENNEFNLTMNPQDWEIISDECYWRDAVESISWLPLTSFLIYVVAFSLGWGPIPWLFMGEALPAKIRGPAASLVTAFNWGCTFIVTKTFQGMIEAIGAYGVFYLFGIVMIFGTAFSIIFVPETKGKTLEEIEAELSGRPYKGNNRRYSEISGIVIK